MLQVSYNRQSEMAINPFKGIKFFMRSVRLRYQLTPIDKKCPFNGVLSDQGFYELNLDKAIFSDLLNLYEKNPGEKLHFSEENYKAIDNLFSNVATHVKAYLGDGAFVDGMMWLTTDAKQGSQRGSANWHTDNVGNRVRLFLCIKGDGSQPTLIVPSKSRIPSFKEWLSNSLLETIRWMGFKFKKSFSNVVEMRHKTGSAFLWDSQLFHRGGYETGQSDRVILSIEFSVPEKHKIAKGPIGTEEHLEFSFDNQLLQSDVFTSFIDKNRLTSGPSASVYAVTNT